MGVRGLAEHVLISIDRGWTLTEAVLKDRMRRIVEQSDRMVDALRNAGKDVKYIVIEDEGHGYLHWKNRMRYLREMEDFLADCLGGRSSGFDFYELGYALF